MVSVVFTLKRKAGPNGRAGSALLWAGALDGRQDGALQVREDPEDNGLAQETQQGGGSGAAGDAQQEVLGGARVVRQALPDARALERDGTALGVVCLEGLNLNFKLNKCPPPLGARRPGVLGGGEGARVADNDPPT